MAGMRKEYDPNKASRRKRRPIIYIICEGKETETKYFKHFRSRNCLVDIVPISSKIREGRLPWAFSGVKRVCRGISIPVDTLCSTVSAPVFLFVGHGVGQLEISVRQGIPAIPT